MCSDGSRTLSGADDKAGVATIVALIARLAKDPSLKHPRLAIAFVPDEEIGHGASLLDLDGFVVRLGHTPWMARRWVSLTMRSLFCGICADNGSRNNGSSGQRKEYYGKCSHTFKRV